MILVLIHQPQIQNPLRFSIALCMATTISQTQNGKTLQFPFISPRKHAYARTHSIVTINRTWCGTRCHAQIFFNIFGIPFLDVLVSFRTNAWFESRPFMRTTTCGWRLHQSQSYHSYSGYNVSTCTEKPKNAYVTQSTISSIHFIILWQWILNWATFFILMRSIVFFLF